MPVVAHDHVWAAGPSGYVCMVPPCTAQCTDASLQANPPANGTVPLQTVIDVAFRAVTGNSF